MEQLHVQIFMLPMMLLLNLANQIKNLRIILLKSKNPLSKILSLRGIEFEWNSKSKNYVGKDYGLIAQEVREIAPHLVKERSDGYLGLKYEGIIPFLVGAIKEQQDKISSLERIYRRN